MTAAIVGGIAGAWIAAGVIDLALDRYRRKRLR